MSMMKIVMDGLSGPYIATGRYLTEDEQYILLRDDAGIKTKIPKSRVVKVEIFDLVPSFADENVVVDNIPVESRVETTQSSPLPPPVEKKKVSIEDLQDIIMKKKSVNAHISEPALPQAAPVKSESMIDVSVVVTGADKQTFSIKVGESALSPANEYTAALQREIANNNTMKTIWEKGIVFDGTPKVMGENIYIKTKSLQDNLGNLGSKFEVMSKLGEATSNFQKPNKNFNVDFSMRSNKSNFAISNSPFDGPVSLEPVGGPEHIEEELYDDLGKEESAGEAEIDQ